MTTPAGGEPSLGSRLAGGAATFAQGVRQGHANVTGRGGGRASSNAPSSKVKIDSSDVSTLQSTLKSTADQASKLESHLKNIREHLAAIGKSGHINLGGGGLGAASGTGGGSYLSGSNANTPTGGAPGAGGSYLGGMTNPTPSNAPGTPLGIRPSVNLMPPGSEPPAGGGGGSYLGTAGALAGGAAGLASTLGNYGASYLGRHLPDMVARQQAAQTLLLNQGKSTTYGSLQTASRTIQNQFTNNSGYADASAASNTLQSMGAISGTTYGNSVLAASNQISSLDPTLGAAGAAQQYQQLTSVSSYYAGRQAGIDMSPGRSTDAIFSDVVKRISRNGRLSASQLSLAQQPGSRLNHDLTTLGLTPDMITEFVRWAQNKNGNGQAGLRNTLGGKSQTLAGSQGNRQTSQDKGMVRGIEGAMGIQTSANNGLADLSNSTPGQMVNALMGGMGQLDSSMKLLIDVMGARGLMGMMGRILGGGGGGGGLGGKVGSKLAGVGSKVVSRAGAAAVTGLEAVGGGSVAVGAATVGLAAGAGVLLGHDANLLTHAGAFSAFGAQSDATIKARNKYSNDSSLTDTINDFNSAGFSKIPACKAEFDNKIKPLIRKADRTKDDGDQQDAMLALKNLMNRYRKQLPAYAIGGKVPGHGNADDVLIRATPGEVVVPKHVVNAHGGPNSLMNALGFEGKGKGGHYAGGGTVSWGDPDAKGFEAQNVTTASAGGFRFSVNKRDVSPFERFVNALIASGYHPHSIQGYNNRNIAGTGHKSNHAWGAAIDIDPDINPRLTGPGKHALPDSVGALAHRFGLNWGGLYRSSKDYMHFEDATAPASGGAQSGAVVSALGGTSSGTTSGGGTGTPTGDGPSGNNAAGYIGQNVAVTGGGSAMFGAASTGDFLTSMLSGGGTTGTKTSGTGLTTGVAGATSSANNTTSAPKTMPKGNLANWIASAMKVLGKSNSTFAPGLTQLIMHESSGNPNAQNNTDSNAKAGHPSKGLMQVIDSTFAQYSMTGHKNIWNPVDNIIAGFKYAESRYGDSMIEAGGRHNSQGNYIGYSRGNYDMVSDELARLHKGEMVLTAKDAGMMRDIVEKGSTLGSRAGNCIHVSGQWTFQVASASEEDARKFAKVFKASIETDHRIAAVASGGH